MNLFCEEVHKLEAEFKQCRKLLNAIGDENRQHLICVMMNMPIDGGLVLEIVEQTHHQGCHSLIWKRSQGSHLRKTKNLQYGDRTQNHGQYKNPYTKIWTNQARTVLFWCLLQPVQDRIPENAEKKGCKILNGLGMSSSRGLLRSNYGPDRRLHWIDVKRIKGDYPGRKWEGADRMIL